MLDGFVDISEVLRSGVYVLLHRGNVVYVGKAKLLLGRIYSHRVAWGRKSRKPLTRSIPARGILFDNVIVKPCPLHEVDTLEAELIAFYKPRYNTQLKSSIPPELVGLVARIVTNRQPPAPSRPLIDRRGF